MHKARVIKAVVTVAGIALLSGAVWFGVTAYQVARRMSDAEIRSHTVTQVCQAIAAYMDANEGRWPESWDDLIDVYPQPAWSVENWPEDLEVIKREVSVNFSIDPGALVDADPETFTAVKPRGYVYDTVVYGGYMLLIETCRKHEAADNTAPETGPASGPTP